MARLYAFMVLVFTITLSSAQDIPKAEIFTGYSLNHVSFPLSTQFVLGNGHGNLQGFELSGTVNANRWFGVVGDFAGYYGTATSGTLFKPPNCVLCTSGFDGTVHNVHTFVAGPQLVLRDGKQAYFAHVLFGGASTKADLDQVNGFSVNPSKTDLSFAMVLGGGFDFAISRHLALRAQPGYLLTRVGGTRANNFRISGGLVFRLGP
ncbi:MAG TPA: hypothetical protein VF532_03270 [Candidatus Angelobacter sp.]